LPCAAKAIVPFAAGRSRDCERRLFASSLVCRVLGGRGGACVILRGHENMMKKVAQLAAAGLAALGMMSATASEAAMMVDGIGVTRLPQIAPIEDAQFFFGGRRYCWYDLGWQGAGWYWCGYEWRRGFGWGGAVGWRGWARPRPGGPGWGVVRPRPGVNRPVNRPGENRPGVNRPGTNRPGVNRPGTNRPGANRPGPNRPGGSRPGGQRGGGNRTRT
jgi:hypothetical protein